VFAGYTSEESKQYKTVKRPNENNKQLHTLDNRR